MAKQYHIALEKGDVGRYVLLPGDPGRCEAIAAHLDEARFVTQHREYCTWTGTLEGVPVSVTSTGIGGASTAIAVEELRRVGADTFLRVGTCGGMQPDIDVNDLVIATAAIRFDGTSREYLPVEFPAVAHPDAVAALREAAAGLPAPCHMGVVQCKDSFYGQHAPETMPIAGELLAKWEAWKRGGCLASEMESATLFILGSVYRLRTGAVLAVAGNQERYDSFVKEGGKPKPFDGPEPAIRAGVEAVRILIHRDRQSALHQ